MTDPVKTRIMKALESLLNEIPELGSVQREHEVPADLDDLDELPALYYWGEEVDRAVRNRIVAPELDLTFWIFDRLISFNGPGLQAFEAAADILAALIHAKLAARQTLRAAGMIDLREKSVFKGKADEKTGLLIMEFALIYGHARGDAFTITY